MTTNWPAQFESQAKKISEPVKLWIREGLDMDLPPSRIALLLNIPIAQVTSVYYADGYYKTAESSNPYIKRGRKKPVEA